MYFHLFFVIANLFAGSPTGDFCSAASLLHLHLPCGESPTSIRSEKDLRLEPTSRGGKRSLLVEGRAEVSRYSSHGLWWGFIKDSTFELLGVAPCTFYFHLWCNSILCFISVKTFSFSQVLSTQTLYLCPSKTHGFHNLSWFSCRWCDVRKIQVTKAPPLGSLHVSILSTGIPVVLGTMDWRAVDSNMNTTVVKDPLSTAWYTHTSRVQNAAKPNLLYAKNCMLREQAAKTHTNQA